ncbi:MAG: ATP-binding protein [Gemmatimonadaceae bacterium]
MLELRWPRMRQPRLAVLVAILVLSLVVTGVLAYQAQDAARSHRATAERALRDYASIAAWDYGLSVKEMLWGAVTDAFYPLKRLDVDASRPLPPPSILYPAVHKAMPCAYGEGADHGSPGHEREDGRSYFRVDMRSRELVISGAPMSAAMQRWVLDTVTTHARTVWDQEWSFALLFGNHQNRHRMLAYALRRNAAGEPVVAYGFDLCLTYFGSPIFEKVYNHYALLPPSLTRGQPNDSLLSVKVTDETGFVLYRSGVQYPPTFSGQYALAGNHGGIHTHVALRPAAADELVIGGLPRSRLPLLLGLLLLTAGLVAIALQQLRREYDLARLRSDFISSVSHELRTPLAQVRMFAETLMLGRVRTEEEGRRSLEIIDQEARRLTNLVENVLQFSRAERRLTRLAPEPTEIASQVRETVEGFAPLAEARQVDVRLSLQEGVVASVDRGALKQTLINLLDNAVKYGPTGQTVTVSMSLAGDRVRISVDDQGPGITARERDRIWEPFYRLERDAASAVAGSGIGLSVVRDLVTQHGGRVWVEPAPGGGARFVVELPGGGTQDAEVERGTRNAEAPGEIPTELPHSASRVPTPGSP